MKVKIGELKTHLSKYLRELGEGDEPIEVCVREETVAYLTPARRGGPLAPAVSPVEERLLRAGIRVSQWAEEAEAQIAPGGCEGPVGGANSVETIRRERDY